MQICCNLIQIEHLVFAIYIFYSIDITKPNIEKFEESIKIGSSNIFVEDGS